MAIIRFIKLKAVVILFFSLCLSASLPTLATTIPEWINCATEGETCSLPVPATVRYGANDTYIYKNLEGSISCNNNTFGDPIFVLKSCEYSLSNTTDYDNDGVVDGVDAFPNDASETHDTDGDGLGDNIDPYPNDSGVWRYCASKYQYCMIPIPAMVRYGNEGEYFYQQVESSIACHGSKFSYLTNTHNPKCEYLLNTTVDYDNDGVVDSEDALPGDATETEDSDNDGIGNNSDPFPNDADNNITGNWQHCVGEFGVCTVPVPALVRYGLDGTYFYKQVGGSIDCKNSAFGNPINVRKVCEYLLSDTADYDNDGVVDSVDAFPADSSESVDTDGDGFGDNADPFLNDADNNMTGNWQHCVGEFGVCTVPIPALVRYGLDGTYFYKQVGGSIDCKNSAFGNPINVRKVCEYLLSDTADYDNDGVVDGADAFPNDASETHDTDGDGLGDNIDPYPNDSGVWRYCASKYQYCMVPIPTMVRYGNEGEYFYQQVENSIACHGSKFSYLTNTHNPKCEYLLNTTVDYDNDGVVDSEDALPGDVTETEDSDNDGIGNNSDPFPNDADNNITGNWQHCVGEFGVCTVPVPALVRYGLDGTYFYKHVEGSIDCKNSAFGNPINVRKVCEYLLSDTADYDNDGVVDGIDAFPSNSSESADTDGDGLGDVADPFPNDATNSAVDAAWVHCANEGRRCHVPLPTVVRYGADEQYTYKRFTQGYISCSAQVFGDLVSQTKHCDYLLSETNDFDGDGVADSIDSFPSNSTETVDTDGDGVGDNSDPYPTDPQNNTDQGWIACADEREVCQVSEPSLVRYGAQDTYHYKIITERVSCTNLALGDPIYGVVKSCSYRPLNDTTAPYAPTLTTTPTITVSDSTSLELNGEIEAQVFINGVDSGEIIPSTGQLLIVLDTSGDYGNKVFVITLKDRFGNTSEPLSLTIDKQPAVPPTITNHKKQGWFDVGEAIEGRFSSIVTDSNNVPYVAYTNNKNGNKVTVKRFNGTTWENVGDEGFSTGYVSSVLINIDNNDVPYVIYSDFGGSRKAVVKRFNGTAWEVVGIEGLSDSSVAYTSIRFDNNNVPYVAYIDQGHFSKAVVKRFNGIAWNIVGDEVVSSDKALSPSIHFDHSNVLYMMYGNDLPIQGNTASSKVIVKRFNGTLWETLSEESFSEAGVHPVMSMDTNNTPHVFYSESSKNHKAAAKRFNGTAWEILGEEGFSKGSSSFHSISIDNNVPYVAYTDSESPRKIVVKRFNGTTWLDVGDIKAYGYYIDISIDSNSVPYIAYSQYLDQWKTTVKKFYDGSINYSILDDQATAIDINATDNYNGTLHYSLIDSHDASLLSINENNGIVTFKTTPDFDNPQDSNKNNTYIFEVKVVNEYGGTTIQKVNILVLKSNRPLLTSVPTATTLNSVTVEVNGQPGNRIFVNNIDTGKFLNDTGVSYLDLDTSGEDGDKVFLLTLKDSLDTESDVLTITILKDTTAPNAPTLTTTPTITFIDSVLVEVNGEIGGQVFINGVDLGEAITPSGKVLIALDTSGKSGDKIFTITLKDTAGNNSESLSFTIDKQSVIPPTITNTKKQGWLNVGGEGASLGQGSGTSIAIDNNNVPYLVYIDSEKQNKATVKRFNDPTWQTVGTEGFSTAGTLFTSISIDNNNVPYVAYSGGYDDGYKAIVKRFNGIAWETVGAGGFSTNRAWHTKMGLDNNNIPYVVYMDATGATANNITNPKTIVKRFNGTTWEAVRTEGFSEGQARDFSINFDNNNILYVSYKESLSNTAYIKRFNGTSWEDVGQPTFLNNDIFTLSTSIDSNNNLYVAYSSGSESIVKRFNGSIWENIGEEGFEQYHTSNLSVVIDNNIPYVAYNNSHTDKLTIKRFYNGSWETLGEEDITEGRATHVSISINNKTPYIAYGGTRVIDPVTVKRFYDGTVIKTVLDQQTAVIDINATDIYNGELEYSLGNSYDAALFIINEDNGIVAFTTIPDVNTPQDSDQDNTYLFEVKVVNEHGGSTVQKVKAIVISNDGLTVNTIPATTSLHQVTIHVNGKPNSRIIVNGIDTGKVLDGNSVKIELDTSGEDGEKAFSLTLIDESDSESEALIFTILKDATAPNAPTLEETPAVTIEDAVSVKIYGEVGAKVFINGFDSGEVINTSGEIPLTLDTSGAYGAKAFTIRLEDALGNISEALSFSINKQAPEAPIITNAKKQGWLDVSDGVSLSQGLYPSISIDSNNIPYIAYADSTSINRITVKRFNGFFWETVGPKGFSKGQALSSAMHIDNNNVPYVAYTDKRNFNKAVVKRFNGSAWEIVGTEGLSTGSIADMSINIDNNNVPYVIYTDTEHASKTIVKRFNGSDWEMVGVEEGSQDGTASPSINFDNNNVPHIVYENREMTQGNAFVSNAIVKRLSNGAWEIVGEGAFSEHNSNYTEINIDSNDTPYVIYNDQGNGSKLTAKRFNGEAWEIVGQEAISTRFTSSSSITISDDNIPYVSYTDANNIIVKYFNGDSWQVVGEETAIENFSNKGLADVNLKISIDNNNIPYVIYTNNEDPTKVVLKRFYDNRINHKVFEDQTTAIDINATDIYNGALIYSLIDSDDAALFTINQNTGIVTFKVAPDFENPHDNNQDNTYVIEVKALNEKGSSTVEKVNIAVIRDDQPKLTTTPTTTVDESITVEINGNEQGERVFVNGVDTQITLSQDKKATITLDTSGGEGYKQFLIQLQKQGVNYISNPLFVSIYKDSSAPKLISGWPETNETIGLNSTNQLELIYTFTDKSGISAIKIYNQEGTDISDSATIDSNSIVLLLTPEQDKSYQFTIIATDSHGNKKEEVLSFNVKNFSPTTITSLPSGLYNEAISINLLAAEGATIYYSTDGYPPIAGAENTQQGSTQINNIVISSTTNLQYFAVDAAGNREKTNSTVYRFNEIDDYNTAIIANYDTTNQQINLSWDNSLNAKAYKIYRVGSKLDLEVLNNSKAQEYLAPAAYLIETSASANFIDTSISNGANYYYAVSKLNANGIETLISEPIKVTVEPTTSATDIRDAIIRTKNWLYSTQNTNGSWGKNKRLKLLATTSALDALYSAKSQNIYITNKGLGYVLGAYADNNDYLSRQILTLLNYDLYTNDKVNKLLSQLSFSPTGWGLLKRYSINAFDTALAYNALKTSKQNPHLGAIIDVTLRTHTDWLSDQGHWNWVNQGEDSVYVSSLVYNVIDADTEDYIWITQAQNLDGSFGNGLLDTLGVVLYLQLPKEQRHQALSYIISQQHSVGHFNNDIYLSALALQALLQGVK